MQHSRRVPFLNPLVLYLTAAELAFPVDDLIDTRNIAGRGRAFEAERRGVSWTVSAAQFAGDINGDGYSDISVASYIEASDISPYAVFLVYGGTGWPERSTMSRGLKGAVTFWLGDVENTGLGRIELVQAGDIDHDGLSDFCFSLDNYHYEPGDSVGRGAVFIVYGNPSLEDQVPVEEIGSEIRGSVILSADPAFTGIGHAAASIGDVNGDGSVDMAVAARETRDLLRFLVLHVLLDTSNLAARVDLSELGGGIPGFRVKVPGYPQTRSLSLAGAGDVDADGYSDVIIGLKSAVYLLYGRASWEQTNDLARMHQEGDGAVRFDPPDFENVSATFSFGTQDQVAGIGDINGDGFADLLLGATHTGLDLFGMAPGLAEAYLVYGRPSFPSTVRLDDLGSHERTRIRGFGASGSAARTGFGKALTNAGDINGDGVQDLLVGAPSRTVNGFFEAGEAYLIHGRRDFPGEISLEAGFDGIRILGSHARAGLGSFVAPAGDFNGDGNADFLVAEPHFIFSAEGTGRVVVIFGTGAGPAPLTVASFEPLSGSVRGGTRVSVRGSGFGEEDLAVRFGERPARSIERVSSTQLIVVAPPAEAPGPVAVSVTSGGVTRSARDAFEYTPNLPLIDLEDPGERGLRIDGESGRSIGKALDFADVDGDGLDDLLIASELTRGAGDGWGVTIVFGSSELPSTMPAFEPGPGRSLIVKERSVFRDLGMEIAGVGDINADGNDDFGVSASDAESYLIFGRGEFATASDLDVEVALGNAVRFVSPEAGGFFRQRFAPLGDFTNDGLNDFVLVQSRSVDFFDLYPGRLWFLQGRRVDDLQPEVELGDAFNAEFAFARLLGPGPNFGFNLANAGDVNRDGFDDLLVSGDSGDRATPVYLLYGGPRLGEVADEPLLDYLARGGGVEFRWEGRPRAPIAAIPMNVAAAGDVDGDGAPDFLIGDEQGGTSNAGITYLISGSPDLPPLVSLPVKADPIDLPGLVRVTGDRGLIQSGRGAGPAGDYNGDGFADFLVGSQNPDAFLPGTMAIVFGGAELPPLLDLGRLGARGVRIDGIHPISHLQESPKRPGDLNGDGVLDFAFSEWSAPGFPLVDGRLSPGAVHVVFGLPDAIDFVRGDANLDGLVDISDAVFVLGFLFLGSLPPLCDDAADVDDSGRIEITDAVRLLDHLFRGALEPPPPYPERGSDPSPDALSCKGY
jgi:hypothetical protein